MFSKRPKEIFHLTFLRHAAIYFICNMLKCKHIQRQIFIYISLFFFIKFVVFAYFTTCISYKLETTKKDWIYSWYIWI